MVEYITKLKNLSGISIRKLLQISGIPQATFTRWKKLDSKNKIIKRKNPRSVLPEEIKIVTDLRKFHYPNIGYKQFTYVIQNHGVYLTKSSIYRLLKHYNLLGWWYKMVNDPANKEYKNKPKRVHQHWHTDICYLTIARVTYYLIILLDGYSRYLLHLKLMSDMTTSSVSDFILEAKNLFPFETPDLISDNGTQFVSRDFKKLLTSLDIEQIFTRRNHPQTNGKAERMIKSVKHEAIKPASPMTFNDALNIIEEYRYIYNHQRLHASLNYLRPADLFFGRENAMLEERKAKTIAARELRIKLNKLRNSSLR